MALGEVLVGKLADEAYIFLNIFSLSLHLLYTVLAPLLL
jgi:hypothetical protein